MQPYIFSQCSHENATQIKRHILISITRKYPPPRDLMSTEFYIVICDEVSVDFREIKPKRLIFRKPSRYTTIFSIRQFSAPQGNVVLITAK